ncbi:MAG: murein biosynthesis integral membrane protein MurJ [Candidatus Sulfobium sp.]
MDQRGKIARAAGAMSAATLISRILGFVRDMVFALYFGAGGTSDAFFAAFRIPNLLRELFAEGSMSAAFIPVLTEYRQKQGEEEAQKLVKITFSFIVIAVGIICILGIIFAPALVTVIAPGFLKSPGKFSLTVLLTRIMFPFLLLVSLAALAMGALNTKKVFFIPALAPAMLNIALIVVIVFFASIARRPIVVAAVGVLIGGLLQFLFQLPSFFRKGYRLGFRPYFRHPGLKKMAILLIPATLALAVNQINILVANILASYLPSGSITYLYYSMRLIQFPIGIFGVAMSMAVLPTLSEHAVRGDIEHLREDFSFALRMLFFISVPAMAALITLREPIVNLLFQRGSFDYAATKGTSEALLFYSFGIWSIVGNRVITSSFYAMQDTRTPVKIATVGMVSNILFSLVLMGPLKHAGLALANALASWVNFSLLSYFLRKKLKRVDARKIAKSFVKIGAASLVMAVTGRVLLHGGLWEKSGGTLEKAAYFTGAAAVCVVIYVAASFMLKSEEMEYFLEALKKRIGRRKA